MYSSEVGITKESILENISQEAIFEKYLGIPVQFNGLICSPLRKDNVPTCGFRFSAGGILYFRDFSGHFWGNCFDLVKFIYGVSYKRALEIIAKDFQLSKIEIGEIPRVLSPNIGKIEEKTYAKIDISWRDYTPQDAAFWRRFYITRAHLYFLKVAPVKDMWINDLHVYGYNPFNPAYAIVLAPGEYKVYFPYDKDRRFLCNTQKVMGWNQLPPTGELMMITKSFKDIAVLLRMGIPSVSWQGESIIPDNQSITELKTRFKHVFTLYDFDLAGIRTANKIRHRYGIHPLFFTNGRFGMHNCEAKDAAEYIEKHGLEASIKLRDYFLKAML